MSTHRTDPRVVLVYQHVVFCLLFGVMLLVRRVPGKLVLAQARKQLPLFLLIAVMTIAYRFAQLEATKDAPGCTRSCGEAHVDPVCVCAGREDLCR